MNNWNMPPGCMHASDLDQYEARNPERAADKDQDDWTECPSPSDEEIDYLKDLARREQEGELHHLQQETYDEWEE